MYTTKAQKLIYKAPQKRNFLEACVLAPQNRKEAILGKLFIFIEAEDETIESAEISQGILEIITNQYYQEKASSTEERLEKSLQKLNDILAELISLGKNKWVNHINALIAVILKNQIYLSKTGKAYALLIRGKENISITEDSSPSLNYPIRLFKHILSGTLEDGDYLILGNASLFSYFSDYKLSQILQNHAKDLQASKEELQTIIQEQEIPKNILALLLLLEKQEVKIPKTEAQKELSPAVKKSKQKIRLQKAVERRQQAKLKKQFPYLFYYLTLDIAKKLLPFLKILKRIIAKQTFPLLKNFCLGLLSQFKNRIEKKPNHSKKYYSVNLNLSPKSSPSKIADYLTILRTKISLGRFLFLFTKKRQIFVVCSILFFIFTSLFFILKKEKPKIAQETDKDQKKEILVRAIQKKEEAENALIFNDQNKAKDLLAEARSLTHAVLGNKTQNPEAQKLQKDIEDQINKLYKIEKINDLSLTADLLPLKPQLETKQILALQNKLYFYSNTDQTIIQLNLENNQLKILSPSFSDIETFKQATALSKDFLVFLSEKNNFFVYQPENNRLEKSNIKPAGEISKIQGYDAKLFLIDANKNQILKYLKTLSGFSKPISWLKEPVDIQQVKDMAIDGSIYLLTNNGSIKQYFKGRERPFKLADKIADLKDTDQIFTKLNYKNIYLFSKSKKKIAVFDKQSKELVKQLVFTSLDSLDDFWVDPTEEKVYLLSNNKIWQTSLSLY